MQRIALLGVGLIGGSLALAWKKEQPELHITGFDTPEVLEKAVAGKVIDAMAATPEDAVQDADMVLLATPLAPMLRLLTHIAPHLPPGCLVTDVGSVKTPVMQHADEVLPSHVVFIGGHPMAGSEKAGVAHADAFLFENATYVLCPPSQVTTEELPRKHPAFIRLIQSTGARVLLMPPSKHDQIAASVSHLPQLLAVSLMHYTAEQNKEDPDYLRLAAGGFRDMTRIASSPFGMWNDVLLANQRPILDAISGFVTSLRRLQNRLIEEDLNAVGAQFAEAQRVRDTIPRDSKGFLHPLADVYVFAEDRPGELLSIIQVLFDEGLNIKDIELLKIREGTGGAFRMSFASDERADTAVEILTRHAFHAYRL